MSNFLITAVAVACCMPGGVLAEAPLHCWQCKAAPATNEDTPYGKQAQYVVASDPFPKLEQVPAAERFPTNGSFRVEKDGTFTVGGKPRYLVATILYEGTDKEPETHTVGYKPELAWLYENLPDYEDTQRLGFDGLGTFATLDWMKLYRPGFGTWPKKMDQWKRTLESNLPLYVDFTASEWSHGSMFPGYKDKPEWSHPNLKNPETGKPIPIEAWTHGSHHWVPYSMIHPEGRAIWKTLWREGARSVIEAGGKPFCYELLNEPAYWEDNEMSRGFFRDWLKANGREMAAASGETAGKVEYLKFVEDCFGRTLDEGAAEIRKVDKSGTALFGFQPVTIRKQGIDLYRANKNMSAIISHTGARGIPECHILLGLADGKPVMDSEMYVGLSSNSIRNAYIQEYMRGLNASYLFKWSRRPGDFNRNKKDGKDEKGRDRWVPDVEEAIKATGRISGYNVLCPYKVATDQLLGIRMAKDDILDVNELFTPRDRGVPVELAVMFSNPSERLGVCAGHEAFRYFDTAVIAAEFAHLPLRVLFEEDLVAKLGNYKMLVVAGADAAYAETPAAIEKFVKVGGTAVFYCDALEQDEYGNPTKSPFPGIGPAGAPVTSEEELVDLAEAKGLKMSAYTAGVTGGAGWTPVAKVAGRDAVFTKRLGKGRMVYVNARMGNESLGAFLAGIAKADFGIGPVAEVKALEADKVLVGFEIKKAVREGREGYIIDSGSAGECAVRFYRTGASAKRTDDVCVRIENHCGRATREVIKPGPDGAYVLKFVNGPVILVFGDKASIAARYRTDGAVFTGGKTTYEERVADAQAFLKRVEERRLAQRDHFTVDSSLVTALDLGRFADRRFVDKAANDGKDGWTDEGAADSLHGTPWGWTNCNGVPMDFIRYDQNDYKDVVVLSSGRVRNVPDKVIGVTVQKKAGAVYFLHATAWPQAGKEAFAYKVNYADGTAAVLPVVCGKNIGDWRHVASSPAMAAAGCVRGWTDDGGRGLYLWRWENPNPEKLVATIDIAAGRGTMPALVAAIAVEAPGGVKVPVDLSAKGCRSIIMKKGVHGSLTNGVWTVGLDQTASGFTGGNLEFPSLTAAGRRYTKLRMKVNMAADADGRYFENPTPQLALLCHDNARHWFFTQFQVPRTLAGDMFFRTDKDPAIWQDIYVDIPNYQLEGRTGDIYGLMLQYQLPWFSGTERSGLQFKDIVFEYEAAVGGTSAAPVGKKP